MDHEGTMENTDCNTGNESDESRPGFTVGDTGSPIRYHNGANGDQIGEDDDREMIPETDPNRVQVIESITARGRRRCVWAKGPFPSNNDSDWVCKNPKCQGTICSNYFKVRKANDDVQAAKESLKKSKKDFEEAKKECEKAKKDYEEAKKECEEAKMDQPGALSESGSNKKYLTLLEKQVRCEEKLLQKEEERVRHEEKLLQKEEERVRYEEKLLLSECNKICERCDRMNGDLLQGSQAGNQTDYQTAQTNAKQLESEARKADAAAAAASDEVDAAPKKLAYSPSSLHKTLNERSESYPIELPHGVENKKLADLKEFYNYCDKVVFRNAKIAPRDISKDCSKDTKYRKCINITCRAILDWKSDPETTKQPESYYRPSPVAQEVQGTQPIIFALVWKINDILGRYGHLTGNQYPPKNNEKSKRWVDAMWSPTLRQQLQFADGNLMEKPIECKPISRKNEGFSKLVNKGSNQIIGHIFQILYDSCFQYCNGLGRDGEATGLVATMVSAKIISARLEGVATATCNAKVKYSENVPLFSEKTTTNLKRKSNNESVDIRLDRNQEENQENGLSPGFVALISFICGENNTSEHQARLSPFSLVQHLGSGAFSCVHLAKPTSTSEAKFIVVKMPKSPVQSLAALKRELLVLKELSHDSVPKLYKEDLVTFTAWERCEKASGQCLTLCMHAGVAARDYFSQNPIGRLNETFKQINEALAHAHGKGWCHLDVQPSNIIIIETLQEPKIVLIDWGCAAKVGEALNGYRGTPPFSHPSLLMKEGEKKWTQRKATASFDMFSFALTISYLIHGKMPWYGFGRPVEVKEEDISKRFEIATGLVRDSDTLNAADKTCLLSMLGEESKGSLDATYNAASRSEDAGTTKRARRKRKL